MGTISPIKYIHKNHGVTSAHTWEIQSRVKVDISVRSSKKTPIDCAIFLSGKAFAVTKA
jgi:hypothetical protein